MKTELEALEFKIKKLKKIKCALLIIFAICTFLFFAQCSIALEQFNR